MLGLEFIRTTFGDTTITLAEKLGISNVNISQWENGKKSIPEKRLEELHSLYHIPKEYFSKELNQLEQLKVKWVKVHKDWKATFHEYEAPVDFNSEGEPIEYATFTGSDTGLSIYLREIEADIKIEKVIEKARNVIKNKSHSYGDECQDPIDSVVDKERNSDLVYKFIKIMEESDITLIEQILIAIEMFNDDSWGENPKFYKNGLSGKILATIREWDKDEKQRLEAEFLENQEAGLLFADDESEE